MPDSISDSKAKFDTYSNLNPPITIGIPFYNAEDYLADSIRSVFAQSYENWELILLDDGSTDKSLEIAHSINDPRVRVISDGLNKKLPFRLNQIVSLSKYDFISRMDADDLISPFKLEKQIAILLRNPNIDLVSTGLFSMSDNFDFIGARWHNENSISFKDLLFKNGIGVLHAAILGRKSWFLRNPYDINIATGQDYELWVRSSYKNDFKIFLMKEALYFYREQKNVTSTKLLRAYRLERKIYDKYIKKYRLFYLVKSYLKTLLVLILDILGKLDYLLSRRSRMNTTSLRDTFNEELKYIKNIKISSLEE